MNKKIFTTVTEQPLVRFRLGWLYTSGQTFSFGIKENNFRNNKINTNLSITSKSVKGGFNVISIIIIVINHYD